MLLLCSSDPAGGCYIETANLDGETNLKPRGSLAATNTLTQTSVIDFHCEATCEPPGKDIFRWRAKVALGRPGTGTNPVEALTLDNLLLRGCKLKNTHWIIGMVVYTGHESKVMMNMAQAPSKRSNIEKRLNIQIGSIFGLLFVCCLIGAIGAGVVVQQFNVNAQWYLEPESESVTFDIDNPALSGTVSFFTFVILFSQMIPISLYVTMEMVKSFLAILIGQDLDMYYAAIDQPAEARTSNLLEELGQVQYIFSDKTGTLTQNVMEFRKCSIGGVTYGEGSTEVERSIAKRAGKALPPDPVIPPGMDPDFKFVDRRLLFDKWREQPTHVTIHEFLLLLAVCHGVQIETKESGEMEYQAASPDEGALVKAAKNLGCAFTRRTPGQVEVTWANGTKESYQVLCSNEFNSTRKRQSVVVQRPNGSLVLFVKGADTMIYQRLRRDEALRDITQEHMEVYAEQGLRTLCLSKRELTQRQFDDWHVEYVRAATSMTDREEMLDAAAELIEVDLELLGATAIEDKLQENVAECIAALAAADIKLWVLTGDKEETAINIGFACAVLEQGMDIMICRARDVDTTKDTAAIAAEEAAIGKEVEDTLRGYTRRAGENNTTPRALVITGGALTYALTEGIKMALLELGMMCKSVICCRVSPDQKASVTKLVRDNLGKITLAIGDGANDVSMIQAAHIGVGIRGLEGMQAALAADYTISQFKFLEKLIMVHGLWSYRRISTLVCYFFYKNVTFAMSMFWFSSLAAFSGQTLFDDMYQALYNIFFTSLPVMSFGGFERDASEKIVKRFPKLYNVGQNNGLFNWTRFLLFSFGAVVHSVILFYFTMYTDDSIPTPNGQMSGLFESGTNVCDNLLWTVTLVMALETRCFTMVTLVFYSLTALVWYVFILAYHALPPGAIGAFDTRDNIFWVFYHIAQSASFWLNKMLTIAICVLPIFAFKFIKQLIDPPMVDVARYFYQDPATHTKPLPTMDTTTIATAAVAPNNNFGAAASDRAVIVGPPDMAKAPAMLEPEPARIGYINGQQCYEQARALVDSDKDKDPAIEGLELQPLRPVVATAVASPVSPIRPTSIRRTNSRTQFHIGPDIEDESLGHGFDFTPAPVIPPELRKGGPSQC